MTDLVPFLAALGTFAAALGAKELIQRWVTRRGDRADAAVVERRQVSVVEAEGNLAVLKALLTETRDRVNGYEKSISEMKAAHAADISELKTENRSLNRQVADLRQSLQDYQLGVRTPRGMVLVPVREIKQIRENHPGILEQRWYPGELEGMEPQGPSTNPMGDGPSIHARITRIDPPGGV